MARRKANLLVIKNDYPSPKSLYSKDDIMRPSYMVNCDSRPTIQQSPESNPSYIMDLVTDKFPDANFSINNTNTTVTKGNISSNLQSPESNPCYTMGLVADL